LDAVDDMCNAFKKIRGIPLFVATLMDNGLLTQDDCNSGSEYLVANFPNAYGANTLNTDKGNMILKPTNLLSVSALLMLEVMACNHL